MLQRCEAMFVSVVAVALLAHGVVSSDVVVDGWTMNSLAFGSCNQQWRPQEMWTRIMEKEPDAMVLSGDAFYTGEKQYGAGEEEERFAPRSMQELRHAMERAKGSRELQALRESLKAPLMAVYDDHDRGVNDGGGAPGGWHSEGVVDRDQRKDLFLTFLDAPKDDIRHTRSGLYMSYLFGDSVQGGQKKVKVIILDSRYSRDPHIIPSLGEFKGLGVFAVLTRLVSAVTGLTSLHKGKMLGEEQWEWLDSELQESQKIGIKVNILVSSVQVFTSNPTVESWGHFPRERQRLLRLLQMRNPAGLIVLSGDVHVGEVITLDSTLEPVEFTSSGLTHDCTDGMGPISIGLCKLTFSVFAKHWPRSSNAFVPERNFGLIKIHWKDQMTGKDTCPFHAIEITLRDANGNPRAAFNRTDCISVGKVLPLDLSFRVRWVAESPTWRLVWISVFLCSTFMSIRISISIWRILCMERHSHVKNKQE